MFIISQASGPGVSHTLLPGSSGVRAKDVARWARAYACHEATTHVLVVGIRRVQLNLHCDVSYGAVDVPLLK